MSEIGNRPSLVAEFASTLEGRRRLLQQTAILRAGDVIEQAMEATGVSQTELAKKLGKSKSWVSQLLSEQNMTIRTVADVLAVLNHELYLSSRTFSVVAPKTAVKVFDWVQADMPELRVLTTTPLPNVARLYG